MSSPRKLTIAFAAGRIAYAAAGIAAPKQAAGPWLGAAAERGGGRVATRALLARDAFLSAGAAVAAVRDESPRGWLAALIASDLSDIAATLADRGELPERGAPGTVAIAGAGALLGIALYRGAGD